MRDKAHHIGAVCALGFMIVAMAITYLGGCRPPDTNPNPDSRPTTTKPVAARALPEGFVAVEGTFIDPSGWPKEIRCLKDDSIMVFVPAGEFQTGLDDSQLKLLAKVEEPYESSWQSLATEQQAQPHVGKLLNADDVAAYDSTDRGVRVGIAMVNRIQDEGLDLPRADLDAWRKQGRTAKALLAIPSGADRLSKAMVEVINDIKRMLVDAPSLFKIMKIEPGPLLTVEDLRDVEKADANRQAATLLLGMMQGEDGPRIAPEDLQKWRDAGRTLEALFRIEAFRAAFLELAMDKDMPTEEVLAKTRVAELREFHPPAGKAKLGAFYIDKYEITNRQYRRFFAEANDAARKPGLWYGASYNINSKPDKYYDFWADAKRNADDQPVACVGEADSRLYAKWAGKELPTVDEWKHAAVGDGRRLFPWGNDFKQGYCSCDIKPPRQPQTQPQSKWQTAKEIVGDLRSLRQEWRKERDGIPPAKVGQFPHDVSPYGCHDMAGNVSEWAIFHKRGSADKLTAMGGNVESSRPEYICPARTTYTDAGKLTGFRTILRVKSP